MNLKYTQNYERANKFKTFITNLLHHWGANRTIMDFSQQFL